MENLSGQETSSSITISGAKLKKNIQKKFYIKKYYKDLLFYWVKKR